MIDSSSDSFESRAIVTYIWVGLGVSAVLLGLFLLYYYREPKSEEKKDEEVESKIQVE